MKKNILSDDEHRRLLTELESSDEGRGDASEAENLKKTPAAARRGRREKSKSTRLKYEAVDPKDIIHKLQGNPGEVFTLYADGGNTEVKVRYEDNKGFFYRWIKGGNYENVKPLDAGRFFNIFKHNDFRVEAKKNDAAKKISLNVDGDYTKPQQEVATMLPVDVEDAVGNVSQEKIVEGELISAQKEQNAKSDTMMVSDVLVEPMTGDRERDKLAAYRNTGVHGNRANKAKDIAPPLAVNSINEPSTDIEKAPVEPSTDIEKAPVERTMDEIFEDFYTRLSGSKIFEGSHNVAERVIGVVRKTRADKNMSFEELKKAFGKHRNMYNVAEKLILHEREVNSVVSPDVDTKVGPDDSLDVAVAGQEVEEAAVDAVAPTIMDSSVVDQTIEPGKEDVVSVETGFIEGELVEPIKTESEKKIEALRETLERARQDYAKMDYKKTGMVDKMKQFFGPSMFKTLSKDGDQDVAVMKMEYQSALMDYKNARLEEVRERSKTPEELKAGLVEVLKEMEIDERANLYAARTEIKAESLGGKILEGVTLSVDWYRNFYKELSTPGKFILSGTMLTAGLGLSAGASLGIAGAGAGFWALKTFSSASSGRGLFDMLETLAQNSRKEKESKAIESLDMEGLTKGLAAIEDGADTKLKEMMRGRTRRVALGILMAALPLGFSAYNAGADALQQLHTAHTADPIETIGKAKEIAAVSRYEKASNLLHTYANHGNPIVSSDAIHASRLSIPPITEIPSVAADVVVSTPVESIAHEVAKPVTAVVEKGGTIIESLRHAKIEGIHPLEAWKEYAAANAKNPFAVSEKFTMPGAQVLVENGKITDIVDKQGVLLGAMRELSGGQPSVWREIKDMSLDQVREKDPDMYRKMTESVVKYQQYLGGNMPALKPDQSVKQLVSGLTKAYIELKRW